MKKSTPAARGLLFWGLTLAATDLPVVLTIEST
jgi:hypothetical protein